VGEHAQGVPGRRVTAAKAALRRFPSGPAACQWRRTVADSKSPIWTTQSVFFFNHLEILPSLKLDLHLCQNDGVPTQFCHRIPAIQPTTPHGTVAAVRGCRRLAWKSSKPAVTCFRGDCSCDSRVRVPPGLSGEAWARHVFVPAPRRRCDASAGISKRIPSAGRCFGRVRAHGIPHRPQWRYSKVPAPARGDRLCRSAEAVQERGVAGPRGSVRGDGVTQSPPDRR